MFPPRLHLHNIDTCWTPFADFVQSIPVARVKASVLVDLVESPNQQARQIIYSYRYFSWSIQRVLD